MKTIADERVRSALEHRLRSLSLASERRWGRMNVQQMLRHLTGGMELVLSGEPLGPPPPRPNRLLKLLALRLPLPWPKGVKGPRDPAGVEVPEPEFEALRARAISALEVLAAWRSGPETAPHPAFGPLTTKEWHRWAYKHADHHLRQFSA